MFGMRFSGLGKGFLSSAPPCVVPLLVLAVAASPGFAGAIVVPTAGAGCLAAVSANDTTTFEPCSVSVSTLPNGGISLSNPSPIELNIPAAAAAQALLLVYTQGDFSAAVPAGTVFPIQYSIGLGGGGGSGSSVLGGALDFGLFEASSPLGTLLQNGGLPTLLGTTCFASAEDTYFGTGCNPASETVTFSQGYTVVSSDSIPYPNPGSETFGVFAIAELDISAPNGVSGTLQFLPDGSADFAGPIPEPATIGSVSLALVALGVYLGRRRK